MSMAMSIKINTAHIVTHSQLDIHNDSCPICRCSLMEKCLDCGNTDGSCECISVLGVCGHGYHLHCISTWLKTKQICPLDNNRWEYKKHDSNCICSKKKISKKNNTEVVEVEEVENSELETSDSEESD